MQDINKIYISDILTDSEWRPVVTKGRVNNQAPGNLKNHFTYSCTRGTGAEHVYRVWMCTHVQRLTGHVLMYRG